MLEMNDLKAGYNASEILHGISLEVPPEQIVAILGPNGSGKSTLLKSIFNLCSIYSGKIIYNGKNITKMPTYKLINEGVSYVPQGRQIFGTMTVLENLELGGFLIDDKEQIKENLENVFARFRFLNMKKNDRALTLSGGQQQILSISRALMQNPSLLLLDEPSLGLFPKMVDYIFNIIKELNQDGMAVLLVEQNTKKAKENANSTYVLENGKIVRML